MRKDMIDKSRKSNARAVIDISFSNVQRNGNIAELLAYLTAVKMKRGIKWINEKSAICC